MARIGSALVVLALAVAPAALAERAQSGEQPIQGGRFEASGVVQVPGTDGVLFVDDGREDAVLWMRIDGSGRQLGKAVPVPLGVRVIDPEGITTDGTWYYVVGSQSKGNWADGAGLVRFRFDHAGRRATHVESVPGMRTSLLAQLPAIARGAGNGLDAFNIEGLAWDPKGRRLLLGLRAPLLNAHAVVVPVAIDPAAALSPRALAVREGDLMQLPLSNGGIRSLEFDDARGVFQVISAPESSGPFTLWQWSGASGAQAQLQSETHFAARLKPEGVTRLKSPRPLTLLVFDSSRYLTIE